MAGVVLENVSRVFPGNVKAVDRVNLQVRDREFLVLVGPSGCGKSTTLRLIAGLEEVTSGEIRIGERLMNRVPPKDRDVALVFQNYALYPHLSVYENLAFGLELRDGAGWLRRTFGRLARPNKAGQFAARRQEIADKVRDAARVLGIGDLLERMPRQLSGGQRQRVALGRALVRQPAVFLFDEPLSNLDARLRIEMRQELKQLHRRLHTTMIYVTHDQVEALTLGERIVVLNRGEVQQVGTPQEVYDWPKNRFVAEFIGSTPMNFLSGVLEEQAGEWRFRRETWSLRLPQSATARLMGHAGREVELGVRAEDVKVAVSAVENDGTFAATVAAVEHLGDAAIVHMEAAGLSELPNDSTRCKEGVVDEGNAGATRLQCKIEARSRLQTADRVWVSVDRERVHLFDLSSGENLICT